MMILDDGHDAFYTEPSLDELIAFAAPKMLTKDNCEEMAERMFEERMKEVIHAEPKYSDGIVLQFIHAVKVCDKKFRKLSKDEKRAALEMLHGTLDEQSILKAFRCVRLAK